MGVDEHAGTGAWADGADARERWIEVARIVVTGLIALLFWQGLVPIRVLWVAIAIGLYPLVKTPCST